MNDLKEAVIKAAEIASAGDVAVSYTHLRAHETVLDLVCRLLLEKKKTEESNPHISLRLNTNKTLNHHACPLLEHTSVIILTDEHP